jgi:hypothetical protein
LAAVSINQSIHAAGAVYPINRLSKQQSFQAAIYPSKQSINLCSSLSKLQSIQASNQSIYVAVFPNNNLSDQQRSIQAAIKNLSKQTISAAAVYQINSLSEQHSIQTIK